MPPDVYLTSSYYRKWALRLEKLLVEHGLAGADEIEAGHALRPGKPLKRKLTAADVPNTLSRGSFSAAGARRRALQARRPRAHQEHSSGNAHAAAALRARQVGVVEAIRGCHVFPDTVAIGKGDDPQWLYTVLFDGRELWGESADPSLKVSIEAFEPYLEPA